jgi:hypothetical protein
VKQVQITDVFEWQAENDVALATSLRKNGLPRHGVPSHFRITDPDLRFSNIGWDKIAQEINHPVISGSMCCFRFYGPLNGKISGLSH